MKNCYVKTDRNDFINHQHHDHIDIVQAYLNDISKYDVLSPEEEKELFYRIKQGDDIALNKMFNCNLKLVISIAKNFSSNKDYKGVGIPDLIQEGNIGLLEAIQRFDPDRGFKFSTYATWWIRQKILKAITDQSRTVRIPLHMYEKINKLNNVQRQLSTLLGNELTTEELAIAMDMSIEKIEQLLIDQYIYEDSVSLDMPVRNSEKEVEDTYLDLIEDKNMTTEEEAVQHLFREDVDDLLKKLTPRERKIIKLRYGFYDDYCMTLEEVGQEFGVTRERIRQIQKKAIKKLQKTSAKKFR